MDLTLKMCTVRQHLMGQARNRVASVDHVAMGAVLLVVR